METIKSKRMNTMLKVAPINGGTAVPNAGMIMGMPKAPAIAPVIVPVVTPGKVNVVKEAIKTPTAPVVENVIETGVTSQVSSRNVVDFKLLSYEQIKKVAMEAIRKINLISEELKGLFYERDEVIDDLMRGLISGQHLLMLGPPGTGKSALAEEMTSRIVEARIFKWLLNKTSDPSEILGPISIKNMERDKFIRKLEGKIADAEIVFLDEIFKSNEPTLNALLPILNERIVYNDGKAVDVPLKMMICASNETPEEDEGLEALYDRILIKHWVDYIKDPGNREKMMAAYNDKKNPFSKSAPKVKTTVSLDEIDALQYFKNAVQVPGNVATSFGKLLNTLDRAGIKFSDRKINWCWDVMKATALLDTRESVDFDDLSAVTYILWEDKKDIDLIRSETAKLINPFNEKIMKWFAESMEMIHHVEEVRQTDKKKATEEALEVKSKVEVIIGKMDKTIAEANKSGRDTTKMMKQRNDISAKTQALVYSVLGINPNNPLNENAELPF